jgi:GAF domain-containing protein/methyl-accepting chemotaxis protein
MKNLLLSSLRFRLALGFALTGILASAVALSLSFVRSQNNLFQEKQNKLLAIISNATLLIDGDEHALLTSAMDAESDIYHELQRKSFAIAETDPEILYVYTMRKNKEGLIYFILDAGHEPGETPQEYKPVEIGTLYESPSELLLENFDDLDRPIAESGFYTDEYGTYLTAYAPIYRSDGQIDGVIGIDVLAQDIMVQQAEFLRTFLILFAISTIASALLGWLSGNLIAKPVLALSKNTSAIKDTSKKLEIKTGISEVNQLVDSFNNMIDTLRTNEEQLQQKTTQLDAQNEELQTSLRQLDKRANQFETISQIMSATTSLEGIQTLLPRIADVISERLGFYHTGIFLLDENHEFAILRASNSESGRQMIERGYKLKVGETGIVGYVTATGYPRIALNVGADSAFFNSPDLPATQSEATLPLRIAGKIIGALDVQSTERNAFQPEDIKALETLADQVALAIQNSNSYEAMQELLEKAQKAAGTSLRDAWLTLQSQEEHAGYRASSNATEQLNKPVTSETIQRAIKSRQTVVETGTSAVLAIPIRLRDEVIGVMNIRGIDNREWNADEVDIAEAVAERLSLALETSLLLRSTQHRADIERITTDVTSRIGASTRFDIILQTAAQELSRALGGSDVLVQIEPVAMKMSAAE